MVFIFVAFFLDILFICMIETTIAAHGAQKFIIQRFLHLNPPWWYRVVEWVLAHLFITVRVSVWVFQIDDFVFLLYVNICFSSFLFNQQWIYIFFFFTHTLSLSFPISFSPNCVHFLVHSLLYAHHLYFILIFLFLKLFDTKKMVHYLSHSMQRVCMTYTLTKFSLVWAHNTHTACMLYLWLVICLLHFVLKFFFEKKNNNIRIKIN